MLFDASLQGFDRCIGVAQGEIDRSQRSWLDVAVIAREQRGQQLAILVVVPRQSFSRSGPIESAVEEPPK